MEFTNIQYTKVVINIDNYITCVYFHTLITNYWVTKLFNALNFKILCQTKSQVNQLAEEIDRDRSTSEWEFLPFIIHTSSPPRVARLFQKLNPTVPERYINRWLTHQKHFDYLFDAFTRIRHVPTVSSLTFVFFFSRSLVAKKCKFELDQKRMNSNKELNSIFSL